jgi:hypothetical protein
MNLLQTLALYCISLVHTLLVFITRLKNAVLGTPLLRRHRSGSNLKYDYESYDINDIMIAYDLADDEGAGVSTGASTGANVACKGESKKGRKGKDSKGKDLKGKDLRRRRMNTSPPSSPKSRNSPSSPSSNPSSNPSSPMTTPSSSAMKSPSSASLRSPGRRETSQGWMLSDDDMPELHSFSSTQQRSIHRANANTPAFSAVTATASTAATAATTTTVQGQDMRQTSRAPTVKRPIKLSKVCNELSEDDYVYDSVYGAVPNNVMRVWKTGSPAADGGGGGGSGSEGGGSNKVGGCGGIEKKLPPVRSFMKK